MSVFDLYERESRIGGYGILLGVPGDNGRSDIKVSSTLDKKSLAAVVSIKMSFPAISMHAVRRHAIRKAQEESDRIRISNRKDLVLSRSEQMSTPLDRNMWAWTVCGAFLPRTKSGFSTLRFLESGYLICAAIELIQCAFGINDVCAMTDDYSKKAIMALRDLGAAQLNVILKVCAIANDEAVSAAGNVLDTIDRMRPVDVSVVPVGNSTVTSFTSAVDLGDSFLAIITPDGMLRVVSKHAEHVRQSPLDVEDVYVGSGSVPAGPGAGDGKVRYDAPAGLPSSAAVPTEGAAPTAGAGAGAGAGAAKVDTSVLTPFLSDSVGAVSPQRAAAFQAALNADFGDARSSEGSDQKADPKSDVYARIVESASQGRALDPGVVQSILSAAGPTGSAVVRDSQGPSLAPIDDSFAVFPSNVGMNALQSKKQEDMMRMPQTSGWLMDADQEKQKRSENVVLAALASRDPARAAQLTANMASMNPVTLRAALKAQRTIPVIRPDFSRQGVSSDVAGPTLGVRMGFVSPAKPPIVTGEGLTVGTQIHQAVAAFNANVAALASQCSK